MTSPMKKKNMKMIMIKKSSAIKTTTINLQTINVPNGSMITLTLKHVYHHSYFIHIYSGTYSLCFHSASKICPFQRGLQVLCIYQYKYHVSPYQINYKSLSITHFTDNALIIYPYIHIYNKTY